MAAAAALSQIADFCRRHGVAESTFGRLAVNDGKFVARLRDGGRLRSDTLGRVQSFVHTPPASIGRGFVMDAPARLPPAGVDRPKHHVRRQQTH